MNKMNMLMVCAVIFVSLAGCATQENALPARTETGYDVVNTMIISSIRQCPDYLSQNEPELMKSCINKKLDSAVDLIRKYQKCHLQSASCSPGSWP